MTPAEFIPVARQILRECLNITCCAVTSAEPDSNHDAQLLIAAPLSPKHTVYIRLEPRTMLALIEAPNGIGLVQNEMQNIARRTLRIGPNNLVGWCSYAAVQLAEHHRPLPNNNTEKLYSKFLNRFRHPDAPTPDALPAGPLARWISTKNQKVQLYATFKGKTLKVYEDARSSTAKPRFMWAYIDRVSGAINQIDHHHYDHINDAKDAAHKYAMAQGWMVKSQPPQIPPQTPPRLHAWTTQWHEPADPKMLVPIVIHQARLNDGRCYELYGDTAENTYTVTMREPSGAEHPGAKVFYSENQALNYIQGQIRTITTP